MLSLCIGIVTVFPTFGNLACAEKHNNNVEIMEATNEWKKAIVNKDIDMLVNFALPEYKENVKRLLTDVNSELYAYFFGSQRSSFYSYMSTARELKILIIKERSVYYYDEDRVKTIPTKNRKKMQQLVEIGEVLAFSFFEVDNKWYVSFEFGYEDY